MSRKNIPRLLDLYYRHLKNSRLLPAKSRGLLAVSGGVDSVVMVSLMINLMDEYQWDLGIVHYNHHSRGTESDEDERFVTNIGNKFGLPVYAGHLLRQPAMSNESWESYARRKRYAFFEHIRHSEHYDWIATAHHADDQAETILLRVIEGTGVDGLQGVREMIGAIVRPLLPFNKDRIIRYAQKLSLHYREDRTNEDTTIPRNYLRHNVIPKLKSINPNLSATMSRIPKISREVVQLVEWELDRLKGEVVNHRIDNGFTIQYTKLKAVPLIVQKNLIRKLTGDNTNEQQWRSHVWDELEQFLNKPVIGNTIMLPKNWELLMDREEMILRKRKEVEVKKSSIVTFPASVPRRVTYKNHTFLLDKLDEIPQYSSNPSVEYIDYANIQGHHLKLRKWKPGDRMKPLGMKGFKKVSDILVDKKVNLFEKESQCLFLADDNIVWLCGVQLDDRYKISPQTQDVVQLTWKYKTPDGEKNR